MFELLPGRSALATFIKTDSSQVVEVLAFCKLDFVVLDAEHAPFDRGTTDRMLLAARAAGLPMLVRVPDHRDATILSVLDLGAAGVVVPHVDSVAQARDVVAAARFVGGRRGISLSARFGGYGTRPRADAIAEADRTLVICQIESGAAVEAVEEIAAVAGVGGLLIGRADLALSLGASGSDAPPVRAATQRTIAAAHARGLPAILACAGEAELGKLIPFGADAFIVGSDQSLLREGASRLPAALALCTG